MINAMIYATLLLSGAAAGIIWTLLSTRKVRERANEKAMWQTNANGWRSIFYSLQRHVPGHVLKEDHTWDAWRLNDRIWHELHGTEPENITRYRWPEPTWEEGEPDL